ncbi:MAG: AAA-like domain-containing protein [Candidatus Delongbacteria bacterium]|nr:AAA-like domain-containing protein [Candidatus Delongbacteria bacterium]MBN2835736.1 AAA-like domain-containing protein [Candidatus Delongbacteria bacterium]
MKFFNTAGPVNRPNHYKIDPLNRWSLDEVLTLIDQEKYFILHAPRQTGKTSSLLALQEYLNNEGKYIAIYANFEVGQAARNNIEDGIKSIITEISKRVDDKDLSVKILQIANEQNHNSSLNSVLTLISEVSSKPVVFFIDEIDSLVGDTLISVLRQIRAGYDKRPENFPQSIILCGVRDIKDYRIQTSGQDIITGGSAFNIKAESLRLGNFTKEEIVILYNEHTKETGQKFNDDCFDLIWEYTEGQPWLVNALGYEVTFKMKENRDRSITITREMIETAKNNLVISRATHLDQLSHKLKEDRVRRVLLPLILGTDAKTEDDDREYCYDLGLIKKTPHGIQVANAIYMEILPRELSKENQDNFLSRFSPDWIDENGLIDTDILFSMFQQFWRENSEIWASHIAGYQEAAPHLVFQAYLQRVSNGKGFISREYGLGRKRTDLMLKWKEGKTEQRIVIELKVLSEKDQYDTIKAKALEQTSDYAIKCNATESHILIFDRDEKMDWREKVFIDSGEFNGMKMKIWGM